MTCRLNGLENEFADISAEQAADDRLLYGKGCHEECCCVLETQAFLEDTSGKVQLAMVSVLNLAGYSSLVQQVLAGSGLQDSTGQCQLLPVTRAGVLHTTALEHSRSTVKQEALPLAHLSPTLVAHLEANLKFPRALCIAAQFLEDGGRHVPQGLSCSTLLKGQ